MAPQRKPIPGRIVRSIRQHGECWIWTASKTKDGYGVLTVGRKQFRAHRAAYEAFNGPIPEGFLVCHRCDVPLCVNPDHLFIGSPKENTADMDAKGRRKAPTVDTHPKYKIRPEEREAIRQLRLNGEKLEDLARRYGVGFQTISGICNRSGPYAARD